MKTAFKSIHIRAGFTLVEIMIVVAIIGLLAAIVTPSYQRARQRGQGSRILEELRLIDGAIDRYAIEFNKKGGDAVSWDAVKLYLKPNTVVYQTQEDPLHNVYGPDFEVDKSPVVPSASFQALSDTCPPAFWSPYL